jgi:hypothetical protein
MHKKTITYFTLIAFIFFTISCCTVYTTKKKRADEAVGLEGKKVQILAVLTTSGEHIEFPKHQPGRISGANIVGSAEMAQAAEELELDKSDIQSIKRIEDAITEILTKDGKTYRIIPETVKEEKDKVTFSYFTYGPSKSISIPLSEVELVWVKSVDPGLTFLSVMGGIAAATLVAGLIIMLTKESCPFIYSFDGEQYIFDAEPYGAAICQGLERTEWCRLDHLKDANGFYKIKIINQVAETQYTDEIKLIVVDHPEGVKIVPDVTGGIHTFVQTYSPYRAYDSEGKDLMSKVSKNDWIFWQTSTEGKNPDRREDLRDTLYFEFPKPHGAQTAKLLVNACTTLWGSQMLKQYLELFGNQVRAWYDEIDHMGPAYHRLMDQKAKSERYLLQIRVETQDGWKTKDLIMGGGPFISKDKAYILDISDVPGDALKIKLTPPVPFWMINYLAVDYSEDLPLQLGEIDALEAIDWKGRDVREALAYDDNNYLIMPNIGDEAELTFQSLPRFNGMERSIILKAGGYYDIHLKEEGPPKTEILKRFMFDPEYMNHYAFKEYLKWKKERIENLELK